MPKPRTKTELLDLSQKNFEKLYTLVDSFSEKKQLADFPEGTLNRNIRDVFTHLHEWHLMFLEWYEIGMAGEKPAMPAKGYTWKMNAELNQMIWKKYQSVSFPDARKRLNSSHLKLKKLIEKHSEEELFTKKKFHWTGSTSLGAYLISATSSHYDWAFKLIKKHK